MTSNNPFNVLVCDDSENSLSNDDINEEVNDIKIKEEPANKDYSIVENNFIQFNILNEDIEKGWYVISNKKTRKKHINTTQNISIEQDRQQPKKWFRDNTWAHHYLIGDVCDKNKIPCYMGDKKKKKQSELYQEVYNRHLTGIKKMYGYLATLQDSLDREEDTVWKHKYYMGIYCDKEGHPLYEMDSYRKDKAIQYQHEYNTNKTHVKKTFTGWNNNK
jgi:hypothetical protein